MEGFEKRMEMNNARSSADATEHRQRRGAEVAAERRINSYSEGDIPEMVESNTPFQRRRSPEEMAKFRLKNMEPDRTSGKDPIEDRRFSPEANLEQGLESEGERLPQLPKQPTPQEQLADVDARIERTTASVGTTQKRIDTLHEELGKENFQNAVVPPSIKEGTSRLEQLQKTKQKMEEQLEETSPQEWSSSDESKEKEFEPTIPRGWTVLKHGTNTTKWGDKNPYTEDRIALDKALSVISQEEFDRDQKNGSQYNTTRTYSDGEGKSFEMDVLFYKDHARHDYDPEYAEKLGEKTKDKIATYYFANVQGGRHPLVPRGEVLVKLGQKNVEGKDVFYFVPESVAQEYSKESGVKLENKELYSDLFEAIKSLPKDEAAELMGAAECRELTSVLYDLRPVAELSADVTSKNEKETLDNITRILKKNNLSVAVDRSSSKGAGLDKVYLNMYVSKDPKLAQEAMELVSSVERPFPAEFHRRFGQLMGFPETAIDAYVEKDCLTDQEKADLGFPKNYEKGPEIIPFGISRKHYREEAEYLKKYFNALIGVFSDTYGTTLSGETLEKYKAEVTSFLTKDFTKDVA